MGRIEKATGNLLGCVFLVLPGLACQMLLAQTQDGKPPAEGAERTVLKCDSSLMNPVPGESIADAARRLGGWKNCMDAMKSAAENTVKRVEVENGHLTVGVLPPGLGTIPGLLNINRLDVYVRNRSPINHGYTFTVRCGTWTQTRSGSADPSGPGGPQENLGNPTFSFDVSPPCNVMDVVLNVTSPDEIKGEPQPTSGPVVHKVWETEKAQELEAIVPIVQYPAASHEADQTPEKRQNARVAEYIARYSHLFDVYHGTLFIAVKPIAARPGDSTYGLGVISQLEVEVMNASPDARTVNIRISCGSWSDSTYLRVPPNRRYSGANTPFGQPSLIYTPGPDCNLGNLQLDTLQRDIQ